jgi:endogenous inhibitor of DNA gyrase (YacG/DUF329 family)
MKTESTNTGRLCSVYCPVCGKVTDKVSFNLLREAGRVAARCPVCQNDTRLDYVGQTATVTHLDAAFEGVFTEMSAEERKAFSGFVRGGK